MEPSHQSILSLPFRVRDTLEEADREDLLAEFFHRAEHSRSAEELVRIAQDYLEDP